MSKAWIDNILLGIVALALAGYLGAKLYSGAGGENVALAAGAGGGAQMCAITLTPKAEKFYLINTKTKWIGAYKVNNKTFRLISTRDYRYDLAIPTLEGNDWERRGVTREQVRTSMPKN